MRKSILKGTLGAFGAIALAQPVFAQDDADSDGDGGSDTATVALLSYLGLSAAEGKTTVGEKGGELEGYIQAASMLDLAGGAIRTKVRKKFPDGAGGFVAVLADDETFKLTDYYIATNRLKLLTQQTDFLETVCPTPDKSDERVGVAAEDGADGGGPKLKPGFEDLFGVLKTDTTITPVAISPGAQLLVDAISAESLGPKKPAWLLASEQTIPTAKSGLLDDFQDVLIKTKPYVRKDCEAGTALFAAASAMAAPGEKGAPSLLEKALLLEGTAKKSLAGVLRVRVEKAGGTLVTKQNIFTTLGFNGVTMSGGLIVTYRLVNPRTGGVTTSGTLICTTKALGLKEINSKGPKGGQCHTPKELRAKRKKKA